MTGKRASEQIVNGVVVGACLVAIGSLRAHADLLNEVIPGAKVSRYSQQVLKVIGQWPPPNMPKTPPFENPVWMKGIRTPKEATYIGTEKLFIVQAPLKAVVSVMENFEGYPEIYDGLREVKVLSREENKIVTSWERESPAFFIPNIKYDQIYVVNRISDSKVIYRYQLKSGNAVNFADGLISLEALDPGTTRVSSLDFYDANWGIFSALVGKIWNESLQNDYKGTIAFKFKIEHPDWNARRLKKEGEQMLDRFPIASIEYVDRLETLFPSLLP